MIFFQFAAGQTDEWQKNQCAVNQEHGESRRCYGPICLTTDRESQVQARPTTSAQLISDTHHLLFGIQAAPGPIA